MSRFHINSITINFDDDIVYDMTFIKDDFSNLIIKNEVRNSHHHSNVALLKTYCYLARHNRTMYTNTKHKRTILPC